MMDPKSTGNMDLSSVDLTEVGRYAETSMAPASASAFSSGNRVKSTSAKGRASVNISSLKGTGVRGGKSVSSRFNGITPRPLDPLSVLPLHELLNHLSPQEVSFFILLDAQLDKVESFYLAREKEMLTRGRMLKIQLVELQEHRKLFHEAQSQTSWATNFLSAAKSVVNLGRLPAKVAPPQSDLCRIRSRKIKSIFRFKGRPSQAPKSFEASAETIQTDAIPKSEAISKTGSDQASSSGVTKAKTRFLKAYTKRKERETAEQNDSSCSDSQRAEDPEDLPGSTRGNTVSKCEGSDAGDNDEQESPGPRQIPLSADPDSYLYAKRKLKRAVLEHYRGLEVLNITGFRKALKKFEKVTKIPVQQQYMAEKVGIDVSAPCRFDSKNFMLQVEKSAFASDKAVAQMMAEMEDLYAAAFARGNKKMATKRLRAGNSSKSHHFSTFRSGAYIGIALPALIEGLVKVSKQSTRQAIPAWGPLLFIYAILLIPILFTFLVGTNLLVWANSRINYIFIFGGYLYLSDDRGSKRSSEIDVLSQLDYRQYFELPSILLSLLCYAFWLSFSLIEHPHVSPMIWPLIWLGVTFIIVFDPINLLHRSSRYWLVRNVAKLFISGTRRVEFTDFWMGDQLCSLIFTLSNIYFFVCVYVNDFHPDWRKCSVNSSTWPAYFALAALPLLIRLIQSVKRYWDSKLLTHLINGGKYGSGIVAYFFYFLWRTHQNERGTIFALWCLTNVIYSFYASAWDFLMDWSVLQIHSTNPLLRPELIYNNHIPMYYFAIVSNVLIRFIWLIYIPKSGPNMMVRTFIAGFLEMLRRLQWNFYRLENEHLGNMDQYRVTREVPLPYAFNNRSRDDDGDDDEEGLKIRRR
uniref:Uncharacterized protein n=1 Tax=Psilocybe cubensis TaxID=181762 RepID=A0A8H7XW23_PSICU